MLFFEQLFLAFKYYGETFRFIDRHNLYKYLIVPALLSLGVALFVAWLVWVSSEMVITGVLSRFDFRQLSGFWGDSIEFVFKTILLALIISGYLKIFRYLLLLVLTPSFVWISGKIQSIELGEMREFSLGMFMKNILRSMEIAVMNFIRDLFITSLVIVVVLILTWTVPLAPFAIIFVECYFFGYAMIDYRNQFLSMSIRESGKVIRKNIGLAVGNGICFNLILLIPLLGIMFGPALALIAAGISIDEVGNNPVIGDKIN
ncbi:MAG TPA: EI24 domain-containing protein [Cyclobacteriaceae bacterium]|nr:EI24 domain-containing protein [Cyclobacteriaceae bacterium]